MCINKQMFSSYRTLYIAANQVLKPYNRKLDVSLYKLDSNRDTIEYINTINDIAKIISHPEYSYMNRKDTKSTS